MLINSQSENEMFFFYTISSSALFEWLSLYYRATLHMPWRGNFPVFCPHVANPKHCHSNWSLWEQLQLYIIKGGELKLNTIMAYHK